MSDNWSNGMARLARQLQQLKHVPEEVRDAVAGQLGDDLASKFSAAQDPYGASWAPRKGKHANPPLDRTGALKRSRKVTVKDDGEVEVSYDSPIAGFHQDGTDRMAARPLLPTAAKGLPSTWRRLISDAVSLALKEAMK